MVGFRKFPVLVCVAAVACAWGAPRVVVETADFAAGVNTNGWSVSSSSWASPDYPTSVVSVSLTGTNLEDGASLTVARHGSRFEVGAVGERKLD